MKTTTVEKKEKSVEVKARPFCMDLTSAMAHTGLKRTQIWKLVTSGLLKIYAPSKKLRKSPKRTGKILVLTSDLEKCVLDGHIRTTDVRTISK